MAEMFRYAIDLRSITAGRGSFTMEFSHYERSPCSHQPAGNRETETRARAISFSRETRQHMGSGRGSRICEPLLHKSSLLPGIREIAYLGFSHSANPSSALRSCASDDSHAGLSQTPPEYREGHLWRSMSQSRSSSSDEVHEE